MGQLKQFIAQVLGFEGWQVADLYWVTSAGVRLLPIGWGLVPRDARLVVVLRRRWMGRCSDCGRRCRKVYEHTKSRRWRDLPWCEHPLLIECAPDRLWCPHCGRACVELLPWADRYQRETRRLQQHVALESQSMPTSHVALRYGLDWHTVRQAERQALERWQATREPQPLRLAGLDEKYLGRRNRFEENFVTLVSNLESGEPVWAGWGRSKATVQAWLATLSPEDKAAIELFAMDMHGPFIQAIRGVESLRHATVVHDPFHIIKRANDALDELRREHLFRAGPQLRAVGRGKRWLYLRAWERCSPEQAAELRTFLGGGNRALAHGRQVVDELRGVLHAPDKASMTIGLDHVLRRTARRANVPMRKLHDSLRSHYAEIVALGEHHPPTGRIEALNNNWETLVRQARGYRDLAFLLLKLRFVTVNPIRTDDGVRRFLALGLPAPYRKAA
jgi:transposase